MFSILHCTTGTYTLDTECTSEVHSVSSVKPIELLHLRTEHVPPLKLGSFSHTHKSCLQTPHNLPSETSTRILQNTSSKRIQQQQLLTMSAASEAPS